MGQLFVSNAALFALSPNEDSSQHGENALSVQVGGEVTSVLSTRAGQRYTVFVQLARQVAGSLSSIVDLQVLTRASLQSSSVYETDFAVWTLSPTHTQRTLPWQVGHLIRVYICM